MEAVTKILASVVLLLVAASLVIGGDDFLCQYTNKKPTNLQPFTVSNKGVTVKSAGYFQLLNETENYYPLNFTTLDFFKDDYSPDHIVQLGMVNCSVLEIHLNRNGGKTYRSNYAHLFLYEEFCLNDGCTAESPGIQLNEDGKFSAENLVFTCLHAERGVADATFTFLNLEIDLGKNKQVGVRQNRLRQAEQPLI